jgi:Heat induced stress protein YflT
MNRVSAVFDDRRDAEKAVDWLRDKGVPNESISVLARTPSETESIAERTGAERVAKDAGSDLARGAGTGLAAGATVGAIFGLAAAAIPGIGPFITAGALANALGAFGGGAVAGAVVGGTSGLIAGALSKWGLDKADADYYAREVERGATFIAVELDGTPLTRDEVEDAFRRFHGRFYSGTASAGARY